MDTPTVHLAESRELVLKPRLKANTNRNKTATFEKALKTSVALHQFVVDASKTFAAGPSTGTDMSEQQPSTLEYQTPRQRKQEAARKIHEEWEQQMEGGNQTGSESPSGLRDIDPYLSMYPERSQAESPSDFLQSYRNTDPTGGNQTGEYPWGYPGGYQTRDYPTELPDIDPLQSYTGNYQWENQTWFEPHISLPMNYPTSEMMHPRTGQASQPEAAPRLGPMDLGAIVHPPA